jgi:hypothetical protein
LDNTTTFSAAVIGSAASKAVVVRDLVLRVRALAHEELLWLVAALLALLFLAQSVVA